MKQFEFNTDAFQMTFITNLDGNKGYFCLIIILNAFHLVRLSLIEDR